MDLDALHAAGVHTIAHLIGLAEALDVPLSELLAHLSLCHTDEGAQLHADLLTRGKQDRQGHGPLAVEVGTQRFA